MIAIYFTYHEVFLLIAITDKPVWCIILWFSCMFPLVLRRLCNLLCPNIFNHIGITLQSININSNIKTRRLSECIYFLLGYFSSVQAFYYLRSSLNFLIYFVNFFHACYFESWSLLHCFLIFILLPFLFFLLGFFKCFLVIESFL